MISTVVAMTTIVVTMVGNAIEMTMRARRRRICCRRWRRTRERQWQYWTSYCCWRCCSHRPYCCRASRCCPPCWDERQRLWKRLWRERRSRLPRWHPPSSPCHPRPFPSCAALNSSRTMLRRYERHLAPSPYCFWICHPLLHPWRSLKRRLPPSTNWKLPPMASYRRSRPGMSTEVPTPAVSAASQSSLSKRRKRTMRYPAAEWHDAPFNIVRCAPLPISLDDSCCLLGGPV
mmetsp:Transcript_22871/g.49450  ORF Transcript_22871/g.49450 Transcript_22871/m.49450 type:complete len:232 (-) Transcript_22871:202-897(-)